MRKPAEPTSRRDPFAWVIASTVLLAALVWACSGTNGDADPGTSSGTTTGASSGASGTSGGTSGTSGTGTTSGNPDDGGQTDGSTSGQIPTEANLKVAFIGDTGKGADFQSVLQLVKAENADLLMVQGDLNYTIQLGAANAWFTVIDAQLNTGATKIPYFAAKGNHDIDWGGGYGPGLKTRYEAWGVTADNGDPTKVNYSIVHKGLKMVFVDDSETSPTRADYVKARLAGDNHIWKICAWHKNMRQSNVGPKNDEMGWGIYENCRAEGAIIAQGHSHTYSRSKTLANMTAQTIDAACSDPFELCVGPGKSFFFDSSLGGEDTRSLDAVASKPHFASTFTGDFGALFITFNVDGDPRKASGYFKTVGGTVTDPPAASGKTTFTIKRTP